MHGFAGCAFFLENKLDLRHMVNACHNMIMELADLHGTSRLTRQEYIKVGEEMSGNMRTCVR